MTKSKLKKNHQHLLNRKGNRKNETLRDSFAKRNSPEYGQGAFYQVRRPAPVLMSEGGHCDSGTAALAPVLRRATIPGWAKGVRRFGG